MSSEIVNKLSKDSVNSVEAGVGLSGPKKKKSNSKKSNTSLFTYLIIKASNRPLRQAEIQDELSKYPYEVNIERKALSRVIHGLEDTGLGIVSDRSGTRYDPTRVWAA